MLEQCLLGIVEKNEDAAFILCGDFNAGAGKKAPIYSDFTIILFRRDWGYVLLDGFKNNDSPFQRCSKDTHVNLNGHKLLALCFQVLIHIF